MPLSECVADWTELGSISGTRHWDAEIYLDCLIARPMVMPGIAPVRLSAARHLSHPRGFVGHDGPSDDCPTRPVNSPEVLKPCRTQLGISDRVLNVLMA